MSSDRFSNIPTFDRGKLADLVSSEKWMNGSRGTRGGLGNEAAQYRYWLERGFAKRQASQQSRQSLPTARLFVNTSCFPLPTRFPQGVRQAA